MKDIFGLSDADFLQKAVSMPPKQSTIKLSDVELNILEWGDHEKPGLLFVHGGAAHARWWSFITPFFLPDYHCIAVDLSGHGDSVRRPKYAPELWHQELYELATSDSLFHSIPVIIGHSMGGLIGVRAAAELGAALPGLMIIDSALRPDITTRDRRRKSVNLLGKLRTYESREQILSCFRLVPPQDCQNTNILEYIAAESIRPLDDRWTWKYDSHAFRDLQPVSIFGLLKEISCPTLIIRGQGSRILDKGTAESMQAELKQAEEIVEIKGAFHHIMLDQPARLIAEIKQALAKWKY